MGEYKHIETAIGRYIAGHYSRAAEIGIGMNTDAARILNDAGILLRATDVKNLQVPAWLPFTVDDVFSPDDALYQGADLIYAIRPAIEMIPPMIALAKKVNCDLVVYHLGFESWGTGGEKIDCGVMLHRYVHRQKPSNSVD